MAYLDLIFPEDWLTHIRTRVREGTVSPVFEAMPRAISFIGADRGLVVPEMVLSLGVSRSLV